MEKPEGVQAKCKLHLATVWVGTSPEDGGPLIMGVSWLDDHILLPFSVWFHNYFIAPFMSAKGYSSCGFPITVIEKYDPNFALDTDDNYPDDDMD